MLNLNKTIKIKSICFSILLGISLLWCAPEEEVIVLTKSGVIQMPIGKTEATLNEIQAPENMMNVFQSIQVLTLRKGMPNFNPADTAKVAPDGNIARLPDFSNLYVLRLPAGFNRDSAVTLLEELPEVIYAEKNQTPYLRQIFPNDVSFPKQWNLNNTGQTGGTPDADIDAPEAWELSRGSDSIRLGIIDGGVDASHVDLSGKVFGDVGYSGSHGTHVAGIAAAKTNNEDGVAGIDWNARIWSERIGDIVVTAQAIIDAVNNGCKVINCSWGLPEFSQTVYDAFVYAYQMGVLPVVALAYSGQPEYPDIFGLWNLMVNASNDRDGIPVGNYTNKRYTDIAAPGVVILSTVPGNLYTRMSGTSMAAPHATGVAGLLLAAKPSLKNYDLEWIIKLTADDRGASGWDEYFGYGRLNAFEAVKRVQPPYQIIRGTPNMTLFANNVQRRFLYKPRPDLNAGVYICDIYQIDITRTFTPGFEEAPWGWFSLTGFSAANPNPCREYIYREAGVNNITLRTFFYWIISNPQNGQSINKWAPVDPNLIPLKYAVLGRGISTAQPDNQIKNYWWPNAGYIGDSIYNSTGVNQNVSQFTETNLPAIFHIKIENDGTITDVFRVRAIEEAHVPPTATWTITYFDALSGGNNITSQITSSSGWTTGSLTPGGYREIRVEVTPASNVPERGVKKINIDSRSSNDPNKVDRVYMVADLWNNAVKPDLQIKNSYETSYLGNNVYNTDGTDQTKSQTVWRQTAVFHIKIERDGEQLVDAVTINGPGSDTNWDIRYYEGINGTTDITQYVVNGTYTTFVVNDPKYITLKITPVSVPHGGIKECLITGISGYNPRKRDVVKAITKVSDPRIISSPVVVDKATYPNTGEQLCRVSNTKELHMVYLSDEGIIYSYSIDSGENWYYEKLGNGLYPCIGINYKGQPWISYTKDGDLICKVRRDDGTWKEILIYDGNENLFAGPPAMQLATGIENKAEYAYITYPVYEGTMPDGPSEQPPENISASYIYITLFDTLEARTHLLDIKTDPNIPLSHPCVAVTPADLIHIAWQQKDEIWYITNTEKVTPENWKEVQWTPKYNLSRTDEISEHPYVESYGDVVYVVWKEGDPGEIVRKERYVWEPSEYEKWTDAENLSNSPQQNSDYPQMSAGDVTLWQEQGAEDKYKVYANIQGKILCLTPDANNVSYVHTNALVKDPKAPQIIVYYCYTDEITEGELYEVKFDKYRFPTEPDEGEEVKYYDGKIGEEIASPYCILRTGYIDYGDYTIDYGNRLEYLLKYLDPCKKYLFQAIVYQDTAGTIRQKLEVEDTLEANMSVYPAIPETINIDISPNSYKEDLESALEIIKTRGVFACLAEFKIYEYETVADSGGGSGPQSAGLERLPIPTLLYSPKPNPFTNRTEIRFQIPVKTRVDLKVYNSAGRLVKILVDEPMNPGVYNLIWDGKDSQERIVSNGIYFIRLKTKDSDATKKTIFVR